MECFISPFGVARSEIFGMILATMQNNGVRALMWLLLLLSASLLTSQTLTPARLDSQEREVEGEHKERALTNEQMHEFAERLRRLVNGKAAVKNQCQVQDQKVSQEVQVEESSQITEISGCKIILVTAKTTNFATGPRHVEFTLSANLADLTTPAAVQTQTFSQCKPIDGAVVKLMSRAAPGKTVHVSRSENKADAKQTESLRGDLSFFFPNLAAAQRAGRTIDRMIQSCGGKEWPDEDDLP